MAAAQLLRARVQARPQAQAQMQELAEAWAQALAQDEAKAFARGGVWQDTAGNYFARFRYVDAGIRGASCRNRKHLLIIWDVDAL